MPVVTNSSTKTTTKGNQAVVSAVPFIRASGEHREPFLEVTKTMTTSDQDLGVFDIPAAGYLRNIVLLVTATGGSGAAVTAAEDGPWSAIKNISLAEPNGAVITSFTTGFEMYLAHKFGGYRDARGSDFKNSPTFSGVAASGGSFQFMLRLPLELSARDGLGSLPNQNSASTFKLRVSLAKASEVFGVVPSVTLPNVTVKAFIESWDQPEASSGGAVNQVSPPALNTTQFWSSTIINYGSGEQTLRLPRVGNYIRNLIFIARRSSSTRANGQADWPTTTTLYSDVRPLDTIDKTVWAQQMYERTGYTGTNEAAMALNNGVFVYDFTHEFDGTLGRENRDLWFPTLTSTRLELRGSFASAGQLTVLTNDVAVAGNVFII